MNILSQIFGFYDKIISGLPTSTQFGVSVLLLIALIWSLVSIFKNGHWIFILIFIILFPGSWPALKAIVTIIWSVIKFLLVRIQLNL